MTEEETKTEEKQPDPKDDIVEDLFSDKEESEIEDQGKEDPVEDKQDKTEDVDLKKKEQEALQRVEKVAKDAEDKLLARARSFERKQELNEFFATPDGQLFGKYKSYIEQSANNPAYARLKISQIPAAILKPSAYSQVLIDARSEADKKAKDSKIGGNTPNVTQRVIDPVENPYSQQNMSPADFKKTVQANRLKMRNA